MVENDNRHLFELVGRLTTAISKSTSLEDALFTSLDFILDYDIADYSVIWFCDKDKKYLCPYYTVCPVDITSQKIDINNPAVKNIIEDKQTISMLSYQNDRQDDQYKAFSNLVESIYAGIDIRSIVAVPIIVGEQCLGLIHFIVVSPDKVIDSDNVDIPMLFSDTLGFFIEKSNFDYTSWSFSEVIISGRNIVKEFTNANYVTRVLDGVNIDVYKGEFLVLLGESGCGKTTLLNIISGLDTLTSGKIDFDGCVISNMSEGELTTLRRNNIGFVFQSYNLMTNINAKQNIDLIGELVDDPMDSLEALDVVNLKNKANLYPSQMSGGQQQRVSIARAIVKKPKIIIADEPTAALDYTTSIEVLKVFSDIVKAGSTLIMVTHNEEISKMADRVIKFRNGRVHNIVINHSPVPYDQLVW